MIKCSNVQMFISFSMDLNMFPILILELPLKYYKNIYVEI
jgi:hypothetical protein